MQGRFFVPPFGGFRILDSDTPVSDKGRKADWYDSLRERGFALAKEDRDWTLVDSDANRRILIDLFTARLPSSKVAKFENFSRRKAQDFSLRSVEVYIYKIAENRRAPDPDRLRAIQAKKSRHMPGSSSADGASTEGHGA
ncbi:hypothetical protein [Burkholderia sp. PU8-34]